MAASRNLVLIYPRPVLLCEYPSGTANFDSKFEIQTCRRVSIRTYTNRVHHAQRKHCFKHHEHTHKLKQTLTLLRRYPGTSPASSRLIVPEAVLDGGYDEAMLLPCGFEAAFRLQIFAHRRLVSIKTGAMCRLRPGACVDLAAWCTSSSSSPMTTTVGPSCGTTGELPANTSCERVSSKFSVAAR